MADMLDTAVSDTKYRTKFFNGSNYEMADIICKTRLFPVLNIVPNGSNYDMAGMLDTTVSDRADQLY